MRAVPIREVIWSLYQLTGEGYVVDGDVVGNVDVEVADVSPRDVERHLAAVGVYVGESGSIRRVSMGAVPHLVLPGSGERVNFEFPFPADVRDFLRLMMDITGDEIVAPAGPLGAVGLFATDIRSDDALSAVLASAALESRRDDSRILVHRQGQPKAVLLPLDAGGLVGHVAFREGEGESRFRMPGMEGHLASELKLVGLVAIRGEWTAVLHGPRAPYSAKTGYRLYDGIVESVNGSGAVVRKEDGSFVRWSLPPAPEGIAAVADDDEVVLERAGADVRAGRFESGEQRLQAMVAAGPAADQRGEIRAALADLRFEWGETLAAHGQLERAVRILDAALEIDRVDRPWQAAEDLNEIGKAWTAIGEPERAVSPYREALEIAQSGAIRKAPQPVSCVRSHERTPWIEADALDGLANAERARGRLREAAGLYEHALAVWKKIDDPMGRSTALTGLGLVRQDLGRFDEAAVLHREALALPARHPVVRATILNNLGSAQLAMHQWDAALASLEEALRVYKSLDDLAGEGTALNNLGAYWEARSDLAKACDAFGAALAASRHADDRRGEAIARAHLERMTSQGSGADEATQSCRTALEAQRQP